MLLIEQYEYEGVRMHVRQGEYSRFDRGIIREVAHEYFWDGLPDRVDVAVDVGAHIGAWSRRLLHLRPGARAIAVEPEPENMTMLRLNTFGMDVQVVDAAVGYDPSMRLQRVAENSGGHRVNYALGGLAVVVLMLDEVLADLPDVDVLKLDCEGCEMAAFQCATDETLLKCRVIVGEHHCPRARFEAQAGARLESLGFEMRYSQRVEEMGMFLARRSD